MKMKKSLFTAAMVLTLGLAAGCGAKDDAPAAQSSAAVAETGAAETQMEETGMAETAGSEEETMAGEEANVVTGTIDEVTDMYFSIENTTGTYYQFAYDEESEVDFSQLSIGDKVEIFYEGELSDVDTFFGKILDIQKLEESEVVE